MTCEPETDDGNLTVFFNDSFSGFNPEYLSPGADVRANEAIRKAITRFLIPSVLTFGIVGNSLNLGLFSHRFFYHGRQLELLERSALAGLTALALSDLIFCVVGVLAAVLPRLTLTESTIANMYYQVYQPALQNWFLFTSTWLTVVISVERFVVVGRPLKARWHLRTRNSVIIYICTYAVGCLMSLPLFLRNRLRYEPPTCPEPGKLYVETGAILVNTGFRTVYNVSWTLFGHVIPTIVLAVANTRLLTVLYRYRAKGMSKPDRYGCTSITITVIAIVFSFFLLICPSMVVDSILMLSTVGLAPIPRGEGFLLALVVTNLLQAIKFSSNFILYCGVMKQFRKTINDVMTCQRGNSRLESLKSSIKPTPL